MATDDISLDLARRRFLEIGILATYGALDGMEDQKRVYELLGRYGSNSGIAFANNLLEQVNESDQLLRLGHLLLIGNTTATFGEGSLWLGERDSLLLRVKDCCSGGRSPAFCEMVCNTGGRTVAKTLCPGRLFLPRTCNHSEGGLLCEFLVRMPGSSDEPDGSRVIHHEESYSRFPPEIVDFLVSHDPCEFWISGMRVLVEAAEPGMIRQLQEDIEQEVFSKVAADLPRSGDLTADQNAENAIHSIRRVITHDPVAAKNGGKEGLSTSCPFSSAPTEFCEIMEALQDKVCRAIDPSLRFSYQCKMSAGAEGCAWSIERRLEEGKGSEPTHNVGDPVKMLAMRYVNGEISKEEFEEKMAMMRKYGFS
jgi:hypothetical protein